MGRSWWVVLAGSLSIGCGSSDEPDGAAGSGGQAGASGSAGSSGSGGGAGSAGAAGSGGTPADECITDTSPAERHVFLCDGLEYDVSVPDTCASTACGLIFDVHGFSMSGKMENANTNLAALGRQHGYIVVNPNAEPDPPVASWTAAEDDPKVFAFLERVMNVFGVDPKRVHFTGFSQGGDMTWRMLCDHADVLASAAPAGFGHSANEKCFTAGQAPSPSVPILFMHGTADALVPFSSAEAARDAVIAAQSMTQAEVVSQDADHVWTRYAGSTGEVFEFIEHDYTGAQLLGGHCYPGSTDPGGEPGQFFSFKCDQTAAFNWGEAVMQFFIAHPRP